MSRILLFLAVCGLLSILGAARPMEAQTSLHTETAMLSTDFALVGYVNILVPFADLIIIFSYYFTYSPRIPLSLQASPLEAFEQWLARYNKDYVDDTLEKAKRLGVFQNNVAVIAQHNSNPASTFAMAINEFADLTFEEFASTRLGLNISLGGALRDRVSKNEEHAATPFRYGDLDEMDLPSEIDWREKGVVTPVKNQGMCGSCKYYIYSFK